MPVPVLSQNQWCKSIAFKEYALGSLALPETFELLQGMFVFVVFFFFFPWGLNLSRTVLMGSVMLLASIWRLGRRC